MVVTESLYKLNEFIFWNIRVTFIEKRVIFIDLLIYIRLGHVKFQLGMSIMKDITKVSYHLTGRVV